MAQSAKYKVCCLWHNVFHFDRSMHDKLFFDCKRFFFFFFFFLYLYFLSLTDVLFSYFFTDVPNALCKLEIYSSVNKIILLSLQNEANSNFHFITFLLVGLIWMSDGKVA